jgi:hypothetical protein
MKPREIERFRLKLEAFLADVVLPMGRTERRQHAEEYVRGLLMDGERKSMSHWQIVFLMEMFRLCSSL